MTLLDELKRNTSKLLCIECFKICNDAKSYVLHKESHLPHDTKPVRPHWMHVEWIEMRAEMIYNAESEYYAANLQPVGMLYNGSE